MHRLTIYSVYHFWRIIMVLCVNLSTKKASLHSHFWRVLESFFPPLPSSCSSLSLFFFMQFVDILFYIIIVCDLVLVIFRLQSVLSAFHILLTICFSHCKSTHHALCTAIGFSQSSVIIEWVQGESSGQNIANSTSNGQNQRDLIEWIGVIHLQVCIFGLLKNCNDLGVSKSSHFLCRITLVSLLCTEHVAFMQPVS